MLIGLDEALYHQSPDPLRTPVTSDHRFYDRYWFSGVDPAGTLAFFVGVGRYTNMGTRDAFLSVVAGTRQHNVRASVLERDVRDDESAALAFTVGPQRVAVLEPFRRLSVRLAAGAAPMAADLTFTSGYPPHLEARHREVRDGRVLQEIQRYDQVGRWTGELEIEGERIPIDDWWGDRDHSWGVRVDVGGLEPGEMHQRSPSFTAWCNFATDRATGLFQVREYADGRPRYVDGRLHWLEDGTVTGSSDVVDIRHEVDFHPGSAIYRQATFGLTLDDGRTVEAHAEPLTQRPWAGRGGGYSRGFTDGMGFGARRGSVVEHDVYDLSDLRRVLLDGHDHHPGHREQHARIRLDGRPGTAHLPIMQRSGAMPGADGGSGAAHSAA